MNTITTFILYMQKLRYREVKGPVQSHTASKWQTAVWPEACISRVSALNPLCSVVSLHWCISSGLKYFVWKWLFMGTTDHTLKTCTFVILTDIAELLGKRPRVDFAPPTPSSKQQPFIPNLAHTGIWTILIMANLNRQKRQWNKHFESWMMYLNPRRSAVSKTNRGRFMCQTLFHTLLGTSFFNSHPGAGCQHHLHFAHVET